jgi:hypothetical protein
VAHHSGDSSARRTTLNADHALHIGLDADKIVVGPYPLKMRTGRGQRRRFGSITELAPKPANGRTREYRIRFSSQLALALLLLCAVLTAAGFAWWTGATGSLLLLGFVSWDQARAAAIGDIAVPREPDVHVLLAREERAAFHRAFTVAKRIQLTWPALRNMLDPAEAGPMLSRALSDLAGVLARRQQIRRLRDELATVNHADLPADSPAVLALLAQRTRVDELWQETGALANRHLTSINAAAIAGENLIREQRISQTAREAEHAIAHLSAGSPARPVAAGDELAERTAAVIAAYRELANRYSAGV